MRSEIAVLAAFNYNLQRHARTIRSEIVRSNIEAGTGECGKLVPKEMLQPQLAHALLGLLGVRAGDGGHFFVDADGALPLLA